MRPGGGTNSNPEVCDLLFQPPLTLSNVLEDHTGWVKTVAISRDGMRIVSGSDDKTVRIRDASTGAEQNVLRGHTNLVNSVAILTDDMRIVSGSDDKTGSIDFRQAMLGFKWTSCYTP